MMFTEDKSTKGKKYANPARTVFDEEAHAFARKHRLRACKPDDGESDACVVIEAKHAQTSKDVSSYKLLLRYQGRTLTTDYSAGSAHLDPPEFWSVLYCLLADVSMIEDRTFEEWCGDFGYSTDSREAERTFNACRDTFPKLRRLLGADFNEIRALEEDALRERFEQTPTWRASAETGAK